ncbi:MAG: Single-stranded DNA-binding protein [candidate division WS6 bacterium OLB20]|uniref:Single-stranded DNA-binding protein n=1 Tax=candidate division WS6 bacterium OLB20 TaxID=1617426 RepID=A0A136M098_9BACT|nr:MAG: Single-stranded DNA-binding protein [candidate division WS6 bacterium OLB20]
MFGDLNRAEIIGNITNDIQVRYTGSGTAVASFGIATNRSYRVEDEWKDETTFHNVVVWGNQAEQLAQRAKKGTRVYVSGRLQTRSWDDADGKKNYKTEIVSDDLILLDRYERGKLEGGAGAGGSFNGGSDAPAAKSSPKGGSGKGKKNDMVIDPDDLPF